MTDTSSTLSTDHAVRTWLGIPFATAERFRRPTLVPFNPDLPYDQKGPAPLQAGDTSWLEADNGFSEDCLNLNVWAPEDVGYEPLPVVVYVFGGGWMLGANTQTTSNAAGLAATGRAVGVAINYRLGAFGWLSLSQYGGALEEATNLGLQDIITPCGGYGRTSPVSAATPKTSPSPATAPAPTPPSPSSPHLQPTASTTTSPPSPACPHAKSRPGALKNGLTLSSPHSTSATTPSVSSPSMRTCWPTRWPRRSRPIPAPRTESTTT
jgi:hypothetical protein